MLKKTFEAQLPQGYRKAMVIDTENKALILLINLAALIISIAVISAALFIIEPQDFSENYSLSRNIFLVIAVILYTAAHELVHGAAYKLLTKQKLKFGANLFVAYCGVPDIYVYRTAALIALLSPFVIFTVLFGLLVLLLENEWDKVYAAVLLGMHIGGCSGDLYNTLIYMFKFRSGDTLMCDTGPKQTFYVRDGESPTLSA